MFRIAGHGGFRWPSAFASRCLRRSRTRRCGARNAGHGRLAHSGGCCCGHARRRLRDLVRQRLRRICRGRADSAAARVRTGGIYCCTGVGNSNPSRRVGARRSCLHRRGRVLLAVVCALPSQIWLARCDTVLRTRRSLRYETARAPRCQRFVAHTRTPACARRDRPAATVPSSSS
jgi:hypothetical protein